MEWQGRSIGAGIIAALALAVTSCADAPDEVEPSTSAGGGGAVVDTAEQPVVYAETISIEGMAHVLEVVEYRSPMDFPLGFTTVLPTDMAVDYVSSGVGDEVRFEAAFAGNRRPDAALSFVALPEGADSADARDRIEVVVAEINGQPVEPIPGDWAVERYRVGDGYSGSLAVGTENEKWFYFLARYPPEFADGMGPRIELILRRWKWSGTGAPLIPG